MEKLIKVYGLQEKSKFHLIYKHILPMQGIIFASITLIIFIAMTVLMFSSGLEASKENLVKVIAIFKNEPFKMFITPVLFSFFSWYKIRDVLWLHYLFDEDGLTKAYKYAEGDVDTSEFIDIYSIYAALINSRKHGIIRYRDNKGEKKRIYLYDLSKKDKDFILEYMNEAKES